MSAVRLDVERPNVRLHFQRHVDIVTVEHAKSVTIRVTSSIDSHHAPRGPKALPPKKPCFFVMSPSACRAIVVEVRALRVAKT